MKRKQFLVIPLLGVLLLGASNLFANQNINRTNLFLSNNFTLQKQDTVGVGLSTKDTSVVVSTVAQSKKVMKEMEKKGWIFTNVTKKFTTEGLSLTVHFKKAVVNKRGLLLNNQKTTTKSTATKKTSKTKKTKK
jgi:hypothetical protein